MKPFDRTLLETSVRNILIAIGDDPDRDVFVSASENFY